MRNKFEQLIEYIINEETDKANELFHNLVVEKSRDIYNELVAEEMHDEMMDEGGMSMDSTDDMMGDIAADEEGMDDMGDMDDMDSDHMDDDHDDMDGEGDMEDRVVDLEDALDDLKAQFEKLMADEEGEPEHHDGVNDPDFNDDMPKEGVMREYVEKVKDFYKGENSEGKGVGAGSIGGSTNSKSTVAGKNDMGGTAKNIAQGSATTDPDGKQYSKPSNVYSKGEKKMGQDKYENSPGANAGNTFSNAKKPVSSEASGTNKKSTLD